jgi:hypothetical protein
MPTFSSIPPPAKAEAPPGFYNHPAPILQGADEPGFRIVARGVVLSDIRLTEPLSRAAVVRGDVAKLASDGSLWARAPGYLPLPWDPDHDYRGFRLAAPIPLGPWLDQVLETGVAWELHEPKAIVEVREFVRQWPAVAKALRIVEPPRPALLIQPGRIRYPRPRPGDPVIDWGGCLDRHCVGDWGLEGWFADAVLTADELWLLELQSTRLRNSHAVRTGHGRVFSRHLTSLPLDGLHRPRVVEIVSDLDREVTAMRTAWGEPPPQETEPCHE